MDAPGSMESTTRSTMIEDSMFSTANTLTQNEKGKSLLGLLSGIFKDENPAEMTFEQVEEKFYEEIFADFIKGQNARNIKNRHPERNRTAKDLLNDKRTCPEETIYQIGNIDSSIDYFDLYCICQEFFDFIERLFGKM